MRKEIIVSIALVALLASCGTKSKSKSITEDYCNCKSNAKGMIEKAKCLTDATAAYSEAVKEVSASEMEAFKAGYEEGIKACD